MKVDSGSNPDSSNNLLKKINQMIKMGGRFFITGVQLGMLKAYAINGMSEEGQKLINEIEDSQFMCNKHNFEKWLPRIKDER